MSPEVRKMSTATRARFNSFPQIQSVPNLRLLCSSSHNSSVSLPDSPAIYRSSKPDCITLADLDEFRQLGLKSIIDFRSYNEYMATKDGHRLLDKEYVLYEVNVPKENYKPGQAVKYERVYVDNVQSDKSSKKRQLNLESKEIEEEKRHFLINFFSLSYLKTVFNRLPWHLWCLGILHFVWDIITWNKLKRFKRFVAVEAVSTWGVFGQYVDIVEVSQPAICSALKLISNPENLPALINCAYGKDRTGIMSALILMCLGESKEYVAEDYAKSTEGLEPIRHLMYHEIVEKHCLKEEFCGSEANTMRDLLMYIEDRYQSVEQYMTHIGFPEEEQRQLKKNLEALDRDSQLSCL